MKADKKPTVKADKKATVKKEKKKRTEFPQFIHILTIAKAGKIEKEIKVYGNLTNLVKKEKEENNIEISYTAASNAIKNEGRYVKANEAYNINIIKRKIIKGNAK